MKDYQSIVKAMQEGNRNAVQEYLLSKGLAITQCPDGLWYGDGSWGTLLEFDTIIVQHLFQKWKHYF